MSGNAAYVGSDVSRLPPLCASGLSKSIGEKHLATALPKNVGVLYWGRFNDLSRDVVDYFC